MKKIITLFWVLAIAGIANNVVAQNTNRYSGKVNYKGTDYNYETSCAATNPMSITTMETYRLTIFTMKKDRKKVVLNTNCTALTIQRNESSIKPNLDIITFTTLTGKKLSADLVGTSKGMNLIFYLDNFMLIPQYNLDSKMGCADFDEAIKNVVYFILKEIK
ncbi:MAG: hypothetical protein HOO91_13665 [Bacteroidales bacterium]|nr:hypothetical protein [Bacteroidales bacterium]